jgi:hypothetical protein
MLAVAEEPRRMSAEIYKGIEFVRISKLPEEQRNQITRTIDHSKIIKILRGKELLSDCVQVNDYDCWMRDSFMKEVISIQSN